MIRTVEQYLESLRDGRVLYHQGERVKDVTTHPVLRRTVELGAMDWVLTNDPELRSKFVKQNEEGEDVHVLWDPPRSAADLVNRREVFIEGVRHGGIGLHCMGVDGMAACTVLAARVDAALGTDYSERVAAYRKYVQHNDLGLTTAQTDVKGDRGLRPSKQVQHKDFYVRVVDKNDDGIVVRGCKYHISSAPMANEAFVLPCRTHQEDDKDYCVVLATPLNAKGITMITAEPEVRGMSTEETDWDSPLASRFGVGDAECMIVFDDVFVPWERVFMCEEWQFSRDIAYLFATFHRLFACCRMVPTMEMVTGVASLMAEYNGLEKYWHIRKKLSHMAQVTEAFKAMSLAACMFPEEDSALDLVHPNQMYINISKYMYADNFPELTKLAQDICGGIVADPICYSDWMNPETQPMIDKYLGAAAGVPTEHRLRAIRLLHDITGGRHVSHNIHAEGSLAAQEMMFYATSDWDSYKKSAKRAAGIPVPDEDPAVERQRVLHEQAAASMPPVDGSYKV